MKKRNLLFAALLIIGVSMVVSCNESSAAKKVSENNPGKQNNYDSLVERGRHLVTTMLCHDCHSPKIMGPKGPELDSSRLLSGYPSDRPLGKVNISMVKKGWPLFAPDLTAAVGPWGASFAGNLTSDETGTGNWTEDQFRNALRKGKLKGLDGSRDLLPPMPWPFIGQLDDNDIKAIYTYLRTTKPVRNIVPAPKSLKELE